MRLLHVPHLAALMARHIAPGLQRAESAGIRVRTWKDRDGQTPWERSCVDARAARAVPRPSRIMGADAHAGAAGLPGRHRERRRRGDVTIQVADCLEWTPPHKPSLVISNPPWDGRLEGADAAWTALRSFLKSRPAAASRTC